jgi:mRNA interferase RelE/StbE
MAIMLYSILLAPEAVEDLRLLNAKQRAEIKDAIARHLRHEPAKVSRARIKRLRGIRRPQFRLRIGDVRIFYDIEGESVHILAIVPKRGAEGWLRKAGKPL